VETWNATEEEVRNIKNVNEIGLSWIRGGKRQNWIFSISTILESDMRGNQEHWMSAGQKEGERGALEKRRSRLIEDMDLGALAEVRKSW